MGDAGVREVKKVKCNVNRVSLVEEVSRQRGLAGNN